MSSLFENLAQCPVADEQKMSEAGQLDFQAMCMDVLEAIEAWLGVEAHDPHSPALHDMYPIAAGEVLHPPRALLSRASETLCLQGGLLCTS